MTHYELQPLAARGALQGYGPLLQKELKSWWGGRRWIVQALLWQLVINGLLVAVLFVLPQVVPDGVADSNPLQGFFSIGSLALAIGVIVMAQDALTTELNSGTAEWLLAKPVARASFILAKWMAHGIGMLVVLIALPGAVALVLLALAGPVDVPAFLVGLVVLALHTFFYLSLTLMMGVLSRSRSVVLAVPLSVLLGGQLILTLLAMLPISQLLLLTPWPLASVATALASGSGLSVELILPLIATAVWSISFIVVALWRFERLEL
jgi:ABC-type transport system involved in multi-copper enzyme maturation permease subunit